jgi:hypothetical protein
MLYGVLYAFDIDILQSETENDAICIYYGYFDIFGYI